MSKIPRSQGSVRRTPPRSDCGYPIDVNKTVVLPANSSSLLAEFPLADWIKYDKTLHGAFALLSSNNINAAQDVLFLPYYKELVWPKANVRVRREGDQMIFTCETFAWRVCLDLDGLQLPDNFFDVLPGIPTTLPWPKELPVPQILRIGNLNV